MAELKTEKTAVSVEEFLKSIVDDVMRADSKKLVKLMRKVSGAEPKMWGPSILGFGYYHYKVESGRENDWFPIGFSPRKQNLTLYLMCGVNHFPEILSRLGKHKTGDDCLYINSLRDIDQKILEELLEAGWKKMKGDVQET